MSMPEEVNVAVAQMEIDYLSPRTNAVRAVEAIEKAAAGGAELVVLPELSNIGYPRSTSTQDKSAYYSASEELDDHFPESIRAAAQRLNLHVIAGFARRLTKVAGSMSNEIGLFSPDGTITCGRKTHLPRIEKRYFSPGSRLALVDTPLGKIGMLVCADNSFPEAARVLAVEGAEILTVSYMAPQLANPELYHSITITRAYENQCFVATAQRVGTQDGTNFSGTSCIADPQGALLAAMGSEEGCTHAILRRDVLIETRLWQTRFHDRRPELYGALTAPLQDLN